MSEQSKNKEEIPREKNEEMSLVPLYSPLDVSRGLQAYRRGDVILYTVRGEPAKIQELIEELDGRGINEVVALVSHRAQDKEVEEVADAAVVNTSENDVHKKE